jgi:PAS domain-containing protein
MVFESHSTARDCDVRDAQGHAPQPSLAGSAGEAFIDRLAGDAFGYEALSLAEQAAGIGVWSIDLDHRMVRATPQFFRTMGSSRRRTECRSPPFGRFVIRRSRPVVDGFRHALDGGIDSYEMEYRIIRPDGQVRWIFGAGRVVRGPTGGRALQAASISTSPSARPPKPRSRRKVELERMNQVLEERVRERREPSRPRRSSAPKPRSGSIRRRRWKRSASLTGGIAHDFNNILQVIMGNLEIARFMLQAPERRDDGSAAARSAVQGDRNGAARFPQRGSARPADAGLFADAAARAARSTSTRSSPTCRR